jgi:hypothetical protein
MELKPYQKVCLALIIVLISFKYAPIIYGKINPGSRVKPGQVWEAKLCNLIVFEPYEHEITQTTLRKVISVDGDEVTYVIQNDTTKYIDDIDDFTFNGKSLQTQCIHDINN